MTRDEFIKTIEDFYAKGVEIIRRKNASYGGATEPFKNFFVVEALEIATAEEAILVRLSDKFSRLATLIARKEPNLIQDETIGDTLQDAANYLAILFALLKSRQEGVESTDARKTPPPPVPLSTEQGGEGSDLGDLNIFTPDPTVVRIPDDTNSD